MLVDNWSRQLHPILIVLSNNTHTTERGNKHTNIVMIQKKPALIKHTQLSNIKNNPFFFLLFLYQINMATVASGFKSVLREKSTHKN